MLLFRKLMRNTRRTLMVVGKEDEALVADILVDLVHSTARKSE